MPIFKEVMYLHVKIGYKNYEIKFENGVYSDKPEELYGEINLEHEAIRISNKFSLKQQAATILHEIIHGVDDNREIGLTEKQVNQLGIGLFEVMIHNPKLFKETIIKLGEE